jgi:hypothetical protein
METPTLKGKRATVVVGNFKDATGVIETSSHNTEPLESCEAFKIKFDPEFSGLDSLNWYKNEIRIDR